MLYAFADILRVDSVRRTDPLTYEVLANLRMILIAFVWERFMNKRLQPIHWLALACIALGCIVKEGGRLMEGGGFAFDGSRKQGYLDVVLQCLRVRVQREVAEVSVRSSPEPSERRHVC